MSHGCKLSDLQFTHVAGVVASLTGTVFLAMPAVVGAAAGAVIRTLAERIGASS